MGQMGRGWDEDEAGERRAGHGRVVDLAKLTIGEDGGDNGDREGREMGIMGRWGRRRSDGVDADGEHQNTKKSLN